MLFNGEWYLCADGALRPVLRGEVQADNGSWAQAHFLVDTGADCTVLSADILTELRLTPLSTGDRLGGVGGIAASVVVETQIQFPRETGERIAFRGRFAAVTELESLDMSVPGRDITNLFAVIVDRPREVVCLLGSRHQYSIGQV